MLNALTAAQRLSYTPEKMNEQWESATKEMQLTPFAWVKEFPDTGFLVINAFYPKQREEFLEEGFAATTMPGATPADLGQTLDLPPEFSGDGLLSLSHLSLST